MWRRSKRRRAEPEPEPRPAPSPLEIVKAYHETTKHHPHRYARALGYMDWDTQPDPFRRYDGAEVLPLEHPEAASGPSFPTLLAGGEAPRAVDLGSISSLFFHSLALSAWKQFQDSRWSLRVNPSSGNLHPTEAYLVAGAVSGLREHPGIHHYAPDRHALELRADVSSEVWASLARELPEAGFYVGLTSIHWRESWKYGERAYRYCQHDLGHALGCLGVASAMQGWQARLVSVSDPDLARLLGVVSQTGLEAEQPDALVAIAPGDPGWLSLEVPPLSVEWAGEPNRLSADHHHWEVIDVVAEAATRSEARPIAAASIDAPFVAEEAAVSGGAVVRQRRSAVSMDGKSTLGGDRFFRILSRSMPGAWAPFSTLPWGAEVHLALFVHRVDGLHPGLYLLVRRGEHEAGTAS